MYDDPPPPPPHYKCVGLIRRRMITIPEVCIGNVARPETADPQSPPNSEKERALIGGRDSSADNENSDGKYQKNLV